MNDKQIFSTEKEFVINTYSKHFGSMQGAIVIYGIGKNTEIILDHFPESDIVGLMDATRTGETLFGKPVLSMEEVISMRVKNIIIVARASNVKIIYRRFAKQAKENGINVYDINGNRIDIETGQSGDKPFPYAKYENITDTALKSAIDKADVISFDVFDTLIARRVLYPGDIFELIGIEFSKKRIEAEHSFYAVGEIPNIYDIYEKMGESDSADKEIETEIQHIILKPKMAEMLNYARNSGKQVLLTSDMYLPKEIIHKILSNLSIDFPMENIIVSCDYKVSKYNGLYDVIKKIANGGKILHIGDNQEADIDCAVKYGIDDTFYAPNAITMLEDCFGEKLLCFANSLQNRIVIGNFVAQMLNDPFLYVESQGRFFLSTNYEMSYAFFAPLVMRIFGYLTEQAEKLNLDVILLSARDGWILEKMYDICKDKYSLPEMIYFYTSRNAAVIASLYNEEDIIRAVNLGYSGAPSELLKIRFLLKDNMLLEKLPNETDREYVLRHKDIILSIAEKQRYNYKKYISTLNIKPNSRAGFFDFVSVGTCLLSLSKVVDFQLFGLFVGAPKINYYPVDTMFVETMSIETMFVEKYNVFQTANSILDNYLLFENILTSFEPSLQGFDNDGKPVFCDESRDEANFSVLREVQAAIIDYFTNIGLSISDMAKVDCEVICCIFEFLSSKYSLLQTDYFENEKLYDGFCNREFALERN